MARTFTRSLLLLFCILKQAQACSFPDVAAPPTLAYFLHKLPSKSFGEIAVKPVASDPHPLDLAAALDDLAKKFSAGSSHDLVKAVDACLTQARANGSVNTDLNALENIRDASMAEGIPGDELRDYVLWRKRNNSWFLGGEATPQEMEEINRNMEAASPSLKPCWLYLMGALKFRVGKAEEAETYFDRVLAGKQPNVASEMALYMKGRCLFSNRPWNNDQALMNARVEAARKVFRQYLSQYPTGRFAADAWGWLGGLEKDGGLALVDFVRQAESTDHPEVFDSAVAQIEQNITNMDRDPASKGFDQVAQHPELALALTYAVLNTTTIPWPEDFYHAALSPEEQTRLKDWRDTALPKLAAAVAAHKDLYQGGAAEERYLTILAHAASDHGDQPQALKLIEMAQQKASPSDDFLFVEGLVFQRLGKLETAVKTWNRLLDAFPRSALVPGTRYRLALALHDLKRNGEAVLELSALTNNILPIVYAGSTEGPPPPSPSAYTYRPRNYNGYYSCYYVVKDSPGAEAPQIRQTIDTLLNFAPAESLVSPLNATDDEHEIFRRQLREIVVARFLVQNDFASAARYTVDPDLKKEYAKKATRSAALLAVKLTSPRNAAPKNPPRSVLAAGSMDMASYWEGHRLKLTWVPLGDTGNFENGLLLGYSKEQMNRELDSRDELSHAILWWNKVEEFDPRGNTTSRALWKTLQARRLIAEQTPYALQRAAETGMPKESRKEYDHLRHAHADSIEAGQYAAWWSLPPAKDPEVSDPYSRREGHVTALMRFGRPGWFAFWHISFDGFDELDCRWGMPYPGSFPEKYPQAPKEELAAFARLLEVFNEIRQNPDDSTNSVALDAAFSDYRMKFPQGSLKNGVLWMHGEVEWNRKHWSAAVHDDARVLEQNESPELKLGAACNLAQIFDQLNDDTLRHDLLQDILKDDSSRAKLKEYVKCGELPFLKDYLLMKVATR